MLKSLVIFLIKECFTFSLRTKNQISSFNVAIPLEDKDVGQHFFIEERSMFITGEIERARDEVSIDILNYCEEAFFCYDKRDILSLIRERRRFFDTTH